MEREYRKSRIKSRISWMIAFVSAVLAVMMAVVPFVFMVLGSFKGRFEILMKGVFAIPKNWNVSNYLEIIKGDFGNYFINSLIVLAISLFLLVMIAAFAAYPLARFQFRTKKLIYGMIIACMCIPVHITLIPIFKMAKAAGVYDSIWALVGPYVAIGIPVSVFMLTGHMKEIPKEIEESATIDGCGRFRLFFEVILPMSKPGLATVAIYHGVNMWNEFIFAYTLTQSRQNATLPLAVWEFQGRYSMHVPMVMTVLTLTAIPMLIFFLLTQGQLEKGMTAGVLKG